MGPGITGERLTLNQPTTYGDGLTRVSNPLSQPIASNTLGRDTVGTYNGPPQVRNFSNQPQSNGGSSNPNRQFVNSMMNNGQAFNFDDATGINTSNNVSTILARLIAGDINGQNIGEEIKQIYGDSLANGGVVPVNVNGQRQYDANFGVGDMSDALKSVGYAQQEGETGLSGPLRAFSANMSRIVASASSLLKNPKIAAEVNSQLRTIGSNIQINPQDQKSVGDAVSKIQENNTQISTQLLQVQKTDGFLGKALTSEQGNGTKVADTILSLGKGEKKAGS
jgi:hypothetical protein